MKTQNYKPVIKVVLAAVLLVFAFQASFAGAFEKKDTLNILTFQGKVIDKSTKKPVVFASVYLDGTSLGTVTNSDGEFILKIPINTRSNKVGVTYLGYKNLLVPLKELDANENVIALEPSPIPIEEVIIRTGDPLDLIMGALKNVKNNYPGNSEQQVGFYRETIKQNRNYIEVAEAVLDVYKSSYSDAFDYDRVKIYKGRKNQDVKKMDTILFKFQGGPKTSFLLDMVKTPGNLLSPDMLQYYDFKLAGIVKINDKENYVIEFDQKDNIDFPLYQGKVYLDVKSLAFTSADFRFSEKGIELAGSELVRKKPVSMKLDVENANYLVNYREMNGKWYLNHVRSELVFKCKWDKKLFSSTYVTMFEMAVTDRDTANVSKFKFKEAAKMSDVFADQVNYFADKNFWGEYNYIKPDESIETAIERLNKKLKLRND
ncbi:MAG: carboxypeptidase-like regulatory domain-containing protein [Bacteroidales bacterium]|nr:carboxypeptidase-like regulatory domain-containing protein [Bacteroidales bacterium]